MSREASHQATFFLVHGTFARHAAWTCEGSPLREQLVASAAANAREAHFVVPQWTGRNNNYDRVAAARDIAQRISTLPPQPPTNPIFLIGHSHGGSVIAHLLINNPHLHKIITGSAFLSTPFIAMRPKSNRVELLSALAFSFGFALYLFLITYILPSYWDPFIQDFSSYCDNPQTAIAFYGCGYLVNHFLLPNNWFNTVMSHLGAIVIDLFPVILGLIIAYVGYLAVYRYHDRLDSIINKKIEAQQTARLPVGNHVFLRVAGDEAASLLAAFQFAAWAIGMITRLASQAVIYVASLWKYFGNYGLGKLLRFAFILQFSVWASVSAWTAAERAQPIWQVLWGYVNDVAWNPNVVWNNFVSGWNDPEAFPILDLTAYVLEKTFIIDSFVVLVSTLFTLVMIVGLPITVAAVKIFGWFDITVALFTDLAIEPVPYGTSRLEHFDWNEEDGDASSWLSHSRTYSHAVALQRLGEWVAESLNGAATSTDSDGDRGAVREIVGGSDATAAEAFTER